jgi:hypothetical protein
MHAVKVNHLRFGMQLQDIGGGHSLDLLEHLGKVVGSWPNGLLSPMLIPGDIVQSFGTCPGSGLYPLPALSERYRVVPIPFPSRYTTSQRIGRVSHECTRTASHASHSHGTP